MASPVRVGSRLKPEIILRVRPARLLICQCRGYLFMPHKVARLTIVVELDPALGGGLLEPLPLVSVTHRVAAKVGHDITGKELEGFAQLLGPGPLMRSEEHTSE